MTTSPINDWLGWLAAGDVAKGTIDNRRSYLNRFAKTVPYLLEASEDDLVAFIDNDDWGTETKRSASASLKSFYGWALRTRLLAPPVGEQLAVNPCDGLYRIRPKVRIPRPIAESDLQYALGRSTREQELMLLLGAYAGLRRSEIASVHGDWVTDLGLIVKGKGGKQRRIPIHERLRPHLRHLKGWAFPSPRKEGQHVVPTYVRDRMNEVLPEPWTPHNLRHRFATKTHEACGDIVVVQQLMGHAKVETTLLYVLVEQDRLASAVANIA